MKSFKNICRGISSLKIQGATNVAKAGIVAYSLNPTQSARNKLLSLRPTEPALFNALKFLDNHSVKETLSYFKDSQEKINNYFLKIIRPNSVIFTHCHSSTIVESLLYAKNKGKKFKVYSTETRPRYQGRKTAKELSNAKIDLTFFVDSAMHEAIESSGIILLGADAILHSGVINKIGSTAIAEIAQVHKKPVYIISDSWKYFPKQLKIEERDFHEVWENAPKHVKIRNPAFEKIPKKYIKKIVSELGILTYKDFLKKAKKFK